MKMLTYKTATRKTNRSFRILAGKLFSCSVLWEGRFQYSLQTLLERIFATHYLAPVRAYSKKGGGGPIQRDIQNMD
jgi:hypothetical protein